jgi:hypothetical protein
MKSGDLVPIQKTSGAIIVVPHPRRSASHSAIRDRSLSQIFSLLAAEFITGNPIGANLF